MYKVCMIFGLDILSQKGEERFWQGYFSHSVSLTGLYFNLRSAKLIMVVRENIDRD